MGNCCRSRYRSTSHRPGYPHKVFKIKQQPEYESYSDDINDDITSVDIEHTQCVDATPASPSTGQRSETNPPRPPIDYDIVWSRAFRQHSDHEHSPQDESKNVIRSHTEDGWTSSRAYGCASFDVTNRATAIEWKGYGLKIQILDDSIPHYLTTASLDVSLHYINNQTYLPVRHGDHNPFSCSALYCIKVGSGKLCKPVTIEIQHCSNSEPEQLTFLRAPSEGEYFRPVTDAIFDKRTNCGRVIVPKLDSMVQDQEYSDFSWFMIAMRWLFLRNTIHYKAQVYISKATTMPRMHFVVTMALDLCSTVVKAKYDEYDLHTSFPVQFDRGSNKIVLNVPEEGTLENGWMIKPLYYPSITKRLVDQFCIFHNNIPKCEFSLQCKQSPPARLSHKIILTGGTANEKSHFSIDFVPPCTSSIVQTSNDSAQLTLAMPTAEQADSSDVTQGCHGQLNEHTVDKYLHTIPSKELVRLGLELGLRYPKLKELESTETFCLNLISAWLREEDEVSERSGKPSWESLAKALEEIGQKGMARSIRDNVIANDH